MISTGRYDEALDDHTSVMEDILDFAIIVGCFVLQQMILRVMVCLHEWLRIYTNELASWVTGLILGILFLLPIVCGFKLIL